MSNDTLRETQRTGVAKIHAVQTGRVRIKRAQITGRGHGIRRMAQPYLSSDWADWSPTYAWVIEHADGVIVIDTGAAAHLKSLPRWHPYFQLAVRFDIEPEQEIGPQLRMLGIGPRDVKTVVLTHLHIDHDGGLAHFPHSKILVDGGELDRASGLKGRLLGYLPNRWPKWFDPSPLAFVKQPFGPFATSAAVTAKGDVLVVPTPGHTPNHVSVIVQDADGGLVLLAGDASYLEANMLSGAVDGVAASEEQGLDTLSKIRALAAQRRTVYLPTHDPESAARLAGRQVVALQARHA
jgi:glyoxylase-like metal-dependent hydrolase (beta-lactamase superfamily II)